MGNTKKISVLLCFVLVVFVGLVNGFKKPNKKVGIYELKSGNLSVKLTNWVANIISLHVPDKHGKLADIALGYDSVKEYMNYSAYLGAIVGRAANRIGGANFFLNGTWYKLVANEGNNTLHGGSKGFSDVVWKVTKYHKDGKIVSVKGTSYDFLKPHTVGSRIKKLPSGYDINYVLDGEKGHHKMKKAAIVHDKKSGRVMEVSTTVPGVQFYTGNYLKDLKGKGGYVYQAHAGLCLETQGFPDAVNHPNFPSQIVTPGNPYRHEMFFKFSTKAAH